MRGHNANELRYTADILAPDGQTVITPGVACGITDLSGSVREQAQLIKPQTSHMLLFRGPDAATITEAGYIQQRGGPLFIVDYLQDPRNPRAGMWTEVYGHVERN